MRTRTRSLRGRDVSDHVTATSPQTLGNPLTTASTSLTTTTTTKTISITSTSITKTTTKATIKQQQFIHSHQALSTTRPDNSSYNNNNKSCLATI